MNWSEPSTKSTSVTGQFMTSVCVWLHCTAPSPPSSPFITLVCKWTQLRNLFRRKNENISKTKIFTYKIKQFSTLHAHYYFILFLSTFSSSWSFYFSHSPSYYSKFLSSPSTRLPAPVLNIYIVHILHYMYYIHTLETCIHHKEIIIWCTLQMY